MATVGNISNINLPDGNKYDIRATAIPHGTVDSTSTATVFTATVPGITALTDGTVVLLQNSVITSASDFTININGLGAKPVYSNMATGNPVTPTAPTRDTTIFNINYTMLFVYSSTLVEGGAWICYRGYNSDNNTIGYQLRTNSAPLPTLTRTRYYRILFTAADNEHWVPANTGYDNSATSKKTVNQNKINPFGRIVYVSGTTNYPAGTNVGASVTWDQYTLALGYSFNTTGAALTLTLYKPVYVKCAPQTDGSAIIDSTTPYVQTLPSTEDGKIYIFLGVAYSATNIELVPHHPVYYYKDGAIRLWTDQVTSGSSVSPYTSNPAMDGTASAGSSNDYSRGDHVHPSDTSRVPVSVTDEYNATSTIDNSGGQIQLGNYQTVSGINNYSYAEVRPSSSSLYASSINTTTGDYLENELEVTATETTIHNVVTPVNNGDAANKQYVDTQVATKQDALVSGTNIKTINNTSLLGSGNVSVQPTLVSGTNIKTINNTSLLGSGNINVSEDFIITETYDLDEDAEVIDKTYAEILAAYNSGKRIYLVDNSTAGMYQPSNITPIAQLTRYDADSRVFTFECNTGNYTHQIYSIDSNDEFSTSPRNYINRSSVTSGTKYGITLSALNSNAPNFYDNLTANITYDWTSTGSVNTLSLGSEYGSALGINVQGKIQLYGTTEYGVTIDSGAPTANRNITFPDKNGTVALTSDTGTQVSIIRYVEA